jgi:3-hydroxyisobutyrate dehydrogenase
MLHGVVDAPREQRPRLAVLGAGSTAGAIVRRLAGVGFDVCVWDSMRARADALVPYGARVARTASAAAAGASTVITMMREADLITEAMTGPDGAVTGMQPGTLWLQLTRVSEQCAEAFAALAGTHRLAYVDAQIAGDWEAAERGRLIVLAAGPESARRQSQPVLDAIGRHTRWFETRGAANSSAHSHPASPPNGGFLCRRA